MWLFAAKLGELEAVTMHQTDLVKQLQDELTGLTDRLKWLDSERGHLMKQRDSLTEEQTSQIKNLQQVQCSIWFGFLYFFIYLYIIFV